MDISDAPPQATYTSGCATVSIQLSAKLDTMRVAMWRGPLQICHACTMLGESHRYMPFDAPNMHHTRDVPHMPNSDSPP